MLHFFPYPQKITTWSLGVFGTFDQANGAGHALSAEAILTHSPHLRATTGSQSTRASNPIIALAGTMAERARRNFNDNAYAHRCAPPGRNPRGRGQRKPD